MRGALYLLLAAMCLSAAASPASAQAPAARSAGDWSLVFMPNDAGLYHWMGRQVRTRGGSCGTVHTTDFIQTELPDAPRAYLVICSEGSYQVTEVRSRIIVDRWRGYPIVWRSE